MDKTITQIVAREVTVERQRQIDKGYTSEHDEQAGLGHLINLAGDRVASQDAYDVSYQEFIEAAALLLAAAEVRKQLDAQIASR